MNIRKVKYAFPWVKSGIAYARLAEDKLYVAMIKEIHIRDKCFWTAEIIDKFQGLCIPIEPTDGFRNKKEAMAACDVALKEHGYLVIPQKFRVMI
jgi:hypothetical protein